MNRHQRRRAAALGVPLANGHPVRVNGHSGLVGADGAPVATPEQRMLADLATTVQLCARELHRMGVDVREVMARPLPRGWHTHRLGVGVVVVAREAAA